MKVGIIVVNYNKRELLYNCLKSLGKITYVNHEVFVVDNGSQDGSKELVEGEFPKVKFIEVGYNSGFCKANNIGINASFSAGCDGVLLLNNDTEVESNFLGEMVSALDAKARVGMVAAKILFMNRRDVIDSAGLLITPDGLAKNRGLEESVSNYSIKEEVFCPAGAAAFYTRKMLEDIEYEKQFLDESFGYYFEELDLGWRARLRGWHCVFVPSAKVYHLKSATSGAYSEFVAFYTNRNIYYNIIKNYPGAYAIKALLLSFLRYVFFFIGILFGEGAGKKISQKIGIWKTIRVTAVGLIDVIKNIRILLQKRKKIQENVKICHKDVEILFKESGLSFMSSLYK